MAVPEAALHFDYEPMFFQDDIGTARQVGIMKPKAVAELIQCAPDGQFGFRIFRPNPRRDLNKSSSKLVRSAAFAANTQSTTISLSDI